METKIVRYETIMVETLKKNQYGDLMVNEVFKVGNKRENLFDVFQVGAEVKVGYASYMNKDYIATAEQTGKHIPLVEAAKKLGAVPVDEIRHDGYVPKVPSGVVERAREPSKPQMSGNVPSAMTPELWDAKEARTRKSIERQTALKEANLFYANAVDASSDKIISLAQVFERYLETGEYHE